jgi:hypothetical protein
MSSSLRGVDSSNVRSAEDLFSPSPNLPSSPYPNNWASYEPNSAAEDNRAVETFLLRIPNTKQTMIS